MAVLNIGVIWMSNLLLIKTYIFLKKVFDGFSKYGTVRKNFLFCALDKLKSWLDAPLFWFKNLFWIRLKSGVEYQFLQSSCRKLRTLFSKRSFVEHIFSMLLFRSPWYFWFCETNTWLILFSGSLGIKQRNLGTVQC